jgi:hypothetical protein
MIMRRCILLFLLLPTLAVNGQQFAEADERQESKPDFVLTGETDATFAIKLRRDPLGGYFLLPDDILSGKYEYAFGLFQIENRQNVISFYWDSWQIDGRYNLRFTPKQMVLYSSHENPNPNYIYWAADITEEQFKALKAMPQFEYKWKSDEKTSRDLSYKNFRQLLRQINRHMGNLKFTIPTKKEFNSVQRVLLNPDLG